MNHKHTHSVFLERWSCRNFSQEQIPPEKIETLLEAARWAPSSFNAQPWRFLIPANQEEKEKYLQILVEANYKWASHAPFFFYLVAQKKFEEKDQLNHMYAFDTGAAWMSIALQAQLLGLCAHAIGGFDRKKAYAELDVDQEKFEILIGIAVGVVETKEPNNRKRKSLDALKL